MDKETAAIQKKLQNELDAYQAGQKDFQKLAQQRQILEGQLNENQCVLDELNLLGPDNKVYKLYGPVLVKQDLEDARQNVGKRIEYIKKESKSCNDTLETLEKKQDKHRENLKKLQQQYQIVMK
ncbi:probable prefoldin subunit 6 [Condylostylus longicornis]|uniref:probable prefoldin subunit 6 n=1 Tax=Condylostylus longicornis TaxID=2530218 RepID=UPI00244DC09F|nr:probable prefoldin subunit 6 [Condylostylus longicornis]